MDGKNKPCHSPGKRRIPWDACRRAWALHPPTRAGGCSPGTRFSAAVFAAGGAPRSTARGRWVMVCCCPGGCYWGVPPWLFFCSVSRHPAPCPVLGVCHGPVAGWAAELLCVPGGCCCGVHGYRANLPAVGSMLALLCSQYAETADTAHCRGVSASRGTAPHTISDADNPCVVWHQIGRQRYHQNQSCHAVVFGLGITAVYRAPVEDNVAGSGIKTRGTGKEIPLMQQ